jgi:hypothetical protein
VPLERFRIGVRKPPALADLQAQGSSPGAAHCQRLYRYAAENASAALDRKWPPYLLNLEFLG